MKTQLCAFAFIASAFATSAWAQIGVEAELDGDDLAVLPEFKAVDSNEDGLINLAETESLAKLLLEEHEVVFKFEEVDENRDGLINNEEYIAYDQTLQEQLDIA
jgi:hypothetical protein